MRSVKAWSWRIAALVGLAAIGASLEHFQFHEPYVGSLLRGLAILGGVVLATYLFRYADPPKQRPPQITAKQVPSKAENQNASGG
ncbi:hypothetical protein [Krasilnikovia sp. MM14-A1259]|uniref:hypothetical protein n=1 Tax=Krasilnikovia sp. MM14-A1259 TaxID=3373539 RepID=UPI0037F639F6